MNKYDITEEQYEWLKDYYKQGYSYYAVDKDGTEGVYSTMPYRRKEWWNSDYSCEVLLKKSLFLTKWEDEPVKIGDIIKGYERANGNDLHYAGKVQPLEISQQNLTKEQFEGAMLFNINKYTARFGKKDNNSKEQEARKILNYAKALYLHTQGKTVNPREDFI